MTRFVRLGLLAAMQFAILAAMIATYAYDMKRGREIVVRTEPVDPRALFRGHYVRLGYPMSAIDIALLDAGCIDSGAPVFVTLRQTGPMAWEPVAAAPAMPEDGFADDRVTLRGRVTSTPNCTERTGSFFVDYGISAYFASPEMARELENRMRGVDREPERLPVILSVPPTGRALIKGIVLDGTRIPDNDIF